MRMPKFVVPVLLALPCASSLISPRQSSAQALERLFYYVDREDSYESLVKNIGPEDPAIWDILKSESRR